MEQVRTNLIGARNARLINSAIEGAERAGVSGDAFGSNTGGISAFQTPGGQVVSQDSFRYTEYSLNVVMVKVGPNGEADYTDGRYWAREVYAKQNPGDDANAAVEIWVFGSGFWGTIENMPEVPGKTHTLATFDASGTDDVQVTGAPTLMRVTQIDGVVGYQGGGGEQPGGNYLFTGAATATGFFPVRVKQNGGADGTPTTIATWTYDVYDLKDEDLATPLNTTGGPIGPERSAARIIEGKVTQAANGSVGIAYRGVTGIVHLWDCIETRTKFACS